MDSEKLAKAKDAALNIATKEVRPKLPIWAWVAAVVGVAGLAVWWFG